MRFRGRSEGVADGYRVGGSGAYPSEVLQAGFPEGKDTKKSYNYTFRSGELRLKNAEGGASGFCGAVRGLSGRAEIPGFRERRGAEIRSPGGKKDKDTPAARAAKNRGASVAGQQKQGPSGIIGQPQFHEFTKLISPIREYPCCGE